MVVFATETGLRHIDDDGGSGDKGCGYHVLFIEEREQRFRFSAAEEAAGLFAGEEYDEGKGEAEAYHQGEWYDIHGAFLCGTTID
jgi:hypothetical protein